MQQSEGISSIDDKDVKNIIVIGKTGQGKSHFLNLLLKEDKGKEGIFKTYSPPDSGTKQCQLAQEKKVQYRNLENEKITMNLTINLIDTPGLFDTNDSADVIAGKYPQSILHLMNIEKTVTLKLNKKISRVLLVISADSNFDSHQQAMIKICKLLTGQELKACVIITKCQRLYDLEEDEEQQIKEKLEKFIKNWKDKLQVSGIEDVFFFARFNINQQFEKYETLNTFYGEQWQKLYSNLQKSIKSTIKVSSDLTFGEQLQLANYFGYTLSRGCLSLEVSIDQINDKTLSAKRDFCKIQCNKINIKGKDDQANQLLGMIHYSEIQSLIFLKFTFAHSQGNGFVELTRDHLIYCCNRQQFLRADQICLNDTLLYNNNRNQENVRIIEIQLIVKEGYYSPLTNTGQFFGNGILLSSYISPSVYPVSQQKAHLAMQPLIIYRQLMMNSIDSKTEKSYKQATPKEYEAIYPKLLRWIFCKNGKQQ